MTIHLEVLPGLPPSGPLATPFAVMGKGLHSEGLVVKVSSDGHGPWVGNFQRGFGRLDAAFVHPNGQHVVAVSRGMVYVVEPSTRALLERFAGDVDELVTFPELQKFGLVGRTDIDVFTTSERWRTRRLSWDGIRIPRRDGPLVIGEAFTPRDDAWYPFEVNVLTRRAVGGSFPEELDELP